MRSTNSSKRPPTQRKISTRKPDSGSRTRTRSSDRRGRTSSTRRGGDEDRRSGRKAKKPDNSKLIIGMSVGGFFLLIMIIVAASSGGKKTNNYSGGSVVNSSSSKKPAFVLPVADRKKIFKEYIAGEEKIEDEAAAKMSSYSGDDIRKHGPQIQAEKRSKLGALRADLSEKYRKKYPKAAGTFIKKIIDEGIDKGWR